jgi:Tol biopolymer transport system component
MCSRRALAVIAAVMAVAMARDARAGDPDRVWWTIETEHFVIHYYDPLGELAQRLAVVAERAHDNLAPALGKEPTTKTQVVLIDETDGANGFASVLPRNKITLYATSPIGESSLNDHDDWLYGLIAHEYTHILHLDSIGGLPSVVNRVLGKTWSPNQIMPRWLIEGLAVYEESKRSSTGRARSNQFDMFVRAAVLRHEELGLDAVSSGPYEFPRGNAAYLYGGKFLTYVFDRYGDDKAGKMSWASGQSSLPFAVNRQIHDVVGESFDALWGDWNGWLRARYTTQLEAVERAGVREGRRLTFDTDGHISPQYSPDGKLLYWLASDGVSPNRIRAMPVGGNVGDAHDIVDSNRFGGWAVLVDGSMVYEQTRPYKGEYDFQDLFYRDGVSGDVTRLTHGLRARDPAVSWDGKRVAFSINGPSHSKLAVMPIAPMDEGAEYEVVFEGGKLDQAFQPSWSPDGTHLAFSVWRHGALRDIFVLDLETRDLTKITDDRAVDGDPVWGPDGNTLFFSSDRSGIYNIYAHDRDTGALWQVTNVIGGAFDPAVSPDGTRLAYHGFDAGGYDLFEIALDREQWTPAKPYIDERPPPTDIPDGGVEVSEKRRYRPAETLSPQSWTAQLDSATSLGTALTLRTTGSDAAGLHTWSLGTTIALDHGEVNVGLGYGYGGFHMPLRVTRARNVAERNGYRIDGISLPYREEALSGTLSVGLPTRRAGRGSLSMSADFDSDYRRIVDEPMLVINPGNQLPRVPVSGYFQDGVALRASWAYSRGFSDTVGPVEGQELSASIRYDDPAIGATFRNFNVNWTYRAYFKLPWGVTPALSLRYGGGLHTGDVDRGDSFSLGGTPQQDIASAMIGTARASTTGYLHGYGSRTVTGDLFHLVNLEYRQRIWQIEKGLSTIPFYVKRLHVAGLADAGAAYTGNPTSDSLRLSLGAALRLDVIFGYFAPGSFELGVARGLTTEGLTQTWLLLTSTI